MRTVLQLDLFADVNTVASCRHQNGVEVIALPGRISSLTEIRIAFHPVGWMWSVSVDTPSGGFGYAPLPKWGNFAPTRGQAIGCAISELLRRCQYWLDLHPKLGQVIRTWATKLLQASDPDWQESMSCTGATWTSCCSAPPDAPGWYEVRPPACSTDDNVPDDESECPKGCYWNGIGWYMDDTAEIPRRQIGSTHEWNLLPIPVPPQQSRMTA